MCECVCLRAWMKGRWNLKLKFQCKFEYKLNFLIKKLYKYMYVRDTSSYNNVKWRFAKVVPYLMS